MIRKIRTAAVIGSGVMGGGIAALLAAPVVRPKGDEHEKPSERAIARAQLQRTSSLKYFLESWV